MTHISIRVIQRALSDNIHLLKFPPHVTDILQPLDKAALDHSSTSGKIKKVDKAEFVNLISSIWYIGMKESNVIAGFETTGI